MFRKLALILLLASPALAQQTLVTGTIQDANGNLYANGTVSATSVVPTGQASTTTGPAPTSIAGIFSINLNSNLSYIFTVCATPVPIGPLANPTPKQTCFASPPILISGPAQDVSTTLNAQAPLLGPGATAGGNGAGGNINPANPFTVPIYSANSTGQNPQLSGSLLTVDQATQGQLNAPSGVTTGASPPPNCNGILGAWCAGQSPVYPSAASGVNSFVADSVNNVWLQILGTGSPVPVPNTFTAPLTISAGGTVSMPLQGSAPKVQGATGTTTSGHCSSYDATGNLQDAGFACVQPSGNSFVDFATPTGTINGSNLTFTLASAPNPASSLTLYHNGIVLVQGTDYTLSSSTITFASTATTPQTGDVISASYRLLSASNFADFEVPTGTINGSNLTFTLAHTPNPSASPVVMVDGAVLIQGTDYTLSTATITFASTATTPKTGDSLVVSYRF